MVGEASQLGIACGQSDMATAVAATHVAGETRTTSDRGRRGKGAYPNPAGASSSRRRGSW